MPTINNTTDRNPTHADRNSTYHDVENCGGYSRIVTGRGVVNDDVSNYGIVISDGSNHDVKNRSIAKRGAPNCDTAQIPSKVSAAEPTGSPNCNTTHHGAANPEVVVRNNVNLSGFRQTGGGSSRQGKGQVTQALTHSASCDSSRQEKEQVTLISTSSTNYYPSGRGKKFSAPQNTHNPGDSAYNPVSNTHHPVSNTHNPRSNTHSPTSKNLGLPADAVIDGHTHSNASDGTQTPRELMVAAAQAGITVVALTDHDTFAGWGEAAAAVPETNVGLIRGVEISAARGSHTAHILGYLPDPTHSGLLAIFQQMLQTRLERLRTMVARIQVDYPKISWQFVAQQALERNVPLGRPHLADALVKAGYYPDRDAAFADALAYGSPYYVHYQAPDIVQVVAMVRAAGGLPVLAHPRSQRRAKSLTESEIMEMVEAGLWGLEQRHRENSTEGRLELADLAQCYGLELTGGSDYHGEGKPNRLGENTLDVAQVERMAALGAVPVLLP